MTLVLTLHFSVITHSWRLHICLSPRTSVTSKATATALVHQLFLNRLQYHLQTWLTEFITTNLFLNMLMVMV